MTGVAAGEVRDLDAAAASSRRRKVLSVVGALCVLALLCALLFGGERKVPLQRHTSLGKDAGGFFGLHGVLEELGYASGRLLSSYGRLPPPESTLLLCLDPIPVSTLRALQLAHVDSGQLRVFENWVRRGGTVLGTLPGRNVLRVLGHEIETAATPSKLDAEQDPLLQVWPGELPAVEVVRDRGLLREAEPSRAGPWPLRVSSDDVDRAPAFFTGHDPKTGTGVAVFSRQLPDNVRPELWLGDHPLVVSAAVDEGRVYLAATALPFTNLGLGRLHCGEPVVRLIDAAAGRGRRRLLFDEFIHGLSPHRGLGWWAWHSALRYPLLAIGLIALVLAWRGAIRLGPPQPERGAVRRAVEEYVVSLADMSRRARRHRAAARRILAAYRTRLRAEVGGAVGAGEADPFGELAGGLGEGERFGLEHLREFDRRAEKVYQSAKSHVLPGATDRT